MKIALRCACALLLLSVTTAHDTDVSPITVSTFAKLLTSLIEASAGLDRPLCPGQCYPRYASLICAPHNIVRTPHGAKRLCPKPTDLCCNRLRDRKVLGDSPSGAVPPQPHAARATDTGLPKTPKPSSSVFSDSPDDDAHLPTQPTDHQEDEEEADHGSEHSVRPILHNDAPAEDSQPSTEPSLPEPVPSSSRQTADERVSELTDGAVSSTVTSPMPSEDQTEPEGIEVPAGDVEEQTEAPETREVASKEELEPGVRREEVKKDGSEAQAIAAVCPGVCVAARISSHCEAALDVEGLCKRSLRCCVSHNLFAGQDGAPKEFVIIKGAGNGGSGGGGGGSGDGGGGGGGVGAANSDSGGTNNKDKDNEDVEDSEASSTNIVNEVDRQVAPTITGKPGTCEGSPNKGTCVATFFSFLCVDVDKNAYCPRNGRCCLTKRSSNATTETPDTSTTISTTITEQRTTTTSTTQSPTTAATTTTTTTTPAPVPTPAPAVLLEIPSCPGTCIPVNKIRLCREPSHVMARTACRDHTVCCDDREAQKLWKQGITTEGTVTVANNNEPDRSQASRPRPNRPAESSAVSSLVPQAIQSLASFFMPSDDQPSNTRPNPNRRRPPHRRPPQDGPDYRPRPPAPPPPPTTSTTTTSTTTTTTTTTTPPPTTTPLPDCPGTCILPILSFTCFGNADLTELFACERSGQKCCAPKSAIRDLERQDMFVNSRRNTSVPELDESLFSSNPVQDLGAAHYGTVAQYGSPYGFESHSESQVPHYTYQQAGTPYHEYSSEVLPQSHYNEELGYNRHDMERHGVGNPYAQHGHAPLQNQGNFPQEDAHEYLQTYPHYTQHQTHPYSGNEYQYQEYPQEMIHQDYTASEYPVSRYNQEHQQQQYHDSLQVPGPTSHPDQRLQHHSIASISQQHPVPQQSPPQQYPARVREPTVSHQQIPQQPSPESLKVPKPAISNVQDKHHHRSPPIQSVPQQPKEDPLPPRRSQPQPPSRPQRPSSSQPPRASHDPHEKQLRPQFIQETTARPTAFTTPSTVNAFPVAEAEASSPYVCGVKGTDQRRTGRVVGGTDAEPGEWCWQVALINSQNQYLCGGALIGTQWVLTAAHCVTNIVRSGDSIYVRVGDHDLTTRYGSPGAQTLRVATTYIHHNHNSQTLDNDIALLKLSGHTELKKGVCLVCLPARGVSQVAGKRCTVTGYGYMGETGPIPLRVREAEVPIVSENECVRKINAVTEKIFILPASSFCAGGESGHDACQGDGGGPLVCEVDGYYEVSGLVSWGFGCGRHEVPGVYGKVASFIGWINQIISVNNHSE